MVSLSGDTFVKIKVNDVNNRAYLQVEPHCHDGEDEGGVDEVREGDGKDERSGCLGEIEDVGISH